LAISCSIGTMFARMLRWVMTTPFGSAVAPEVKMISAVVSALIAGGVPPALRRRSSSTEPGAASPESRAPSPGWFASSDSLQTGREAPSAAASTASPARVARASTIQATRSRNYGDAP
jgi:hypothetical protein